MSARTSIAMLFARLRLNLPNARSVLIASARSSLSVSALATELAEVAAAQGLGVTLIELQDPPAAPYAAGTRSTSAQLEAELRSNAARSGPGSVEIVATGSISELKENALHEAMARPDRFFVVLGSGLLDSPSTLLAVAEVDAVVIVARRGTTARSDLQECRVEIERAGGKLAGGVLLA